MSISWSISSAHLEHRCLWETGLLCAVTTVFVIDITDVITNHPCACFPVSYMQLFECYTHWVWQRCDRFVLKWTWKGNCCRNNYLELLSCNVSFGFVTIDALTKSPWKEEDTFFVCSFWQTSLCLPHLCNFNTDSLILILFVCAVCRCV